MKVKIIKEAGYKQALLGIGLSYGKEHLSDHYLEKIAKRLAPKNGGHNKFLESMMVWIDIDAPRYWWQQFDTYRIGVTKQSESTMHTIMNRELRKEDFEEGEIWQQTLDSLNVHIRLGIKSKNKKNKGYHFCLVINNKPESFLQRRIVLTNYGTIARIMFQRRNHKLKQWVIFINGMRKLKRFNLIESVLKEKNE